MNNVLFKSFDSAHAYDSAAVNAFSQKMAKRQLDWDEFLPKADALGNDTIQVKMINSETKESTSFRVANSKLYTLKNELNKNFSFGFAYTDLFSAIKVAKSKESWSDNEVEFTISGGNEVEDSEKTFEFTYKTQEQHDSVIKTVQLLSSEFNRTNLTMQRWADVQCSKDMFAVAHRLGFYLRTNLFGAEVSQEEVAVTSKFHWYHASGWCSTLNDLQVALSVYNIEFERLLTSFERFLFTFDRAMAAAMKGKQMVFGRRVCID